MRKQEGDELRTISVRHSANARSPVATPSGVSAVAVMSDIAVFKEQALCKSASKPSEAPLLFQSKNSQVHCQEQSP